MSSSLNALSESFVPLVAADSSPREAAFNSINLKVLPSGGASSAPGAPESDAACAKPVITLQRTGEIVTGIRVQCGCGRITDLSCVY